MAQKHVDTLGQFAQSKNEKLVFMPLAASGVIGALGGMTDMLKNLNVKKDDEDRKHLP